MPKLGPTLSRGEPPGRIRVTNGAYAYPSRDPSGRKHAPAPVELVQGYRNAVYCCAQVNATAVATQPIRLFATTDGRKGEKAPGRRTKSLSRSRERSLAENPGLSKRLAGVDRVDEVTDHPILELLEYVNPFFNRTQLFEALQLNLEIDGRWFWYLGARLAGKPVELWPLPSWMVYVVPDYVGTRVIDRFVFAAAGGQSVLDPGNVLYGRELSLLDLYTSGTSWLRASYDHARAYDENISYRESVLRNRGRPDAALIPNEPGGEVTVDPDAIARVKGEYAQEFGRDGAGRLFVPPGGMTLSPIGWTPQDMGELALSKSVLHDIARAAGVPIPLIDGESANRANMDAALLQHARFCVRPRCRKLEEHLNSNFVPLWDDRLFLAFDDPVPADQVLERETNRAYVDLVKTRNEARADLGLAPVEGGDELYLAGTATPIGRLDEVIDLRVRQSREAPKPDEVPAEGRETEDEPAPEEEDGEFEEGEDVEGQDEPPAKSLVTGGEHRPPFRRRWHADQV